MKNKQKKEFTPYEKRTYYLNRTDDKVFSKGQVKKAISYINGVNLGLNYRGSLKVSTKYVQETLVPSLENKIIHNFRKSVINPNDIEQSTILKAFFEGFTFKDTKS